jgi:hypothetical protein
MELFDKKPTPTPPRRGTLKKKPHLTPPGRGTLLVKLFNPPLGGQGGKKRIRGVKNKRG